MDGANPHLPSQLCDAVNAGQLPVQMVGGETEADSAGELVEENSLPARRKFFHVQEIKLPVDQRPRRWRARCTCTVVPFLAARVRDDVTVADFDRDGAHP
jgi:hypothetical protein